MAYLYDGRFIPAGAGIGTMLVTLRPRLAVHPRECGDQFSIMRHVPITDGSSPRVRGSVHVHLAALAAIRFIPASAGIGIAACASSIRCAVHPRECGDRRLNAIEQDDSAGSSPRVRGSGAALAESWSFLRFIPASAGIGVFLRLGRFVLPVHPRECGDRESPHTGRAPRFGSSPRVRGSVFIAPGAVLI